MLATDRAKGRKLVTQRVQSGIRLGPARRVLEGRPVAEPLAQGAVSPGIARDPTSPSIPRRVPVVVPGGARIADLGRGSVVEEQGGAPAWRGAAAGGAAAGQDREERHTRLNQIARAPRAVVNCLRGLFPPRLQAAGIPVRAVGPQTATGFEVRAFVMHFQSQVLNCLESLAAAITRHATRALLFAPAIFISRLHKSS